MKENLIIVESPTKEKVLKEILGEKYRITSSKGHVKDLPKSRLGIDIEKEYEPTWIIIPAKRILVKKLKSLAENKENIFLATDPDREGEAISWHIATELNIENKECRIVFNEITKNAIVNAVNNPRKLDMDLVDSQIARRLLDRLVGYKVSPLCYRYTRGKSAGRVQSVAVHLIVKREEEIQAFQPKEFWKITVQLGKNKSGKINSFEASLTTKNGEKIAIENKKKSEEICHDLKKRKYFVSEIQDKKEYKHPPLPLRTSTLQQMAYNRLNYSVKRTMRIAQQLYEGIAITGHGTMGLITYMRTDSTRISDDAKIKAREHIKKYYGKEYLSTKKSNFSKRGNNQKIQDAHEAIRPTNIDFIPDLIKDSLTSEQFKVYSLIWEYFITSQMKSALLERNKVKIKAEEYGLELNGTKILFPGYLKVFGENEIEKNIIPDLIANEELDLLKILPKQSFTKPPARYNEASLVKVLEKEGIGRPSTYAVIIDKIQSRNYVEKENKTFIPTNLGKTVDKFLVNYFSDIINIKFTAEMENSLDEIEAGKHQWKTMLDKIYKILLEDISNLDKNPPKLLLQQSREMTEEKCSVCDSPMEIKNGPYGKYLSCSENPSKHPTRPYMIKVGIPCPEKKCDGEIIKRKSKKGRTFYGCSNYPNCKFFSNKLPVNKKCPKCDSILVKTTSKKKGDFYQCISSKCDYREEIIKNGKNVSDN